jgi:hypothetical protein
MDGQQILERVFSNVGSMCLQDGMQKVRGSNPLSSTDVMSQHIEDTPDPH